uniref:FGGY family carbohydrate kinase n=1 Tax=Clostridium sp. NkU-1 TaxID=1095009 RepID=UPI0006D2A483
MKNVMVINMGLKSIRCIVFNENGMKLFNEAIPIKTAISAEKVEQDPREWWQSAEKLIERAACECKDICIDYITVTASASCLVCVDKKGTPLMRAFMVSDKRAEEESKYISELDEFKKVYEETLLDMSASLMLPRILWVKRNMPEVFDETDKFLSPNDFMLYMLSGLYVTDYFNAIKYHYNIEKRYYPENLLNVLGISGERLPRVMDPGDTIGKICPDLAGRLGINKNAEIIVSSYDAICSFVGSGAAEDGEASDVSGTVTVLRALSRNSSLKSNSLIYNLPLYKEDAHIIGGSNNLGGGLIEWVKQCYYQNEIYPYEIMEKEAGESVLGARGLIFLPYLLGERAPIWDDNARGVFFGIERMHTRKDMTRAVFESTGFIDMDMIAAIEQTGTKISSVRLSGGLARINLISQIKADILGRDVLVLSEFETTSTGAAMMVLLGKGYFADLREAAEKFVSVRMIIKPNMINHQKYMYMYELYKDTYETVKDLYVRRKKLIKEMVDDREVRIENL